MIDKIDFNIPAENQDDLDKVKIKDNGEPLVDILGMSTRLTMAPEHPLFDFPRTSLVRQSVAQKLVKAAENLPDGLFLSVVEGYRSISIQRRMYTYALGKVKQEHPEWSQARLELEAGRRSAPPDAASPPPHITGGAFDIDIVNERGESMDLSSPFSKIDWRQAPALSHGLTQTAYKNRLFLYHLLTPTGLTNYSDEWWHWSYGDNGWALRVGAPFAIYGRIDL